MSYHIKYINILYISDTSYNKYEFEYINNSILIFLHNFKQQKYPGRSIMWLPIYMVS